MPTYLPQIEANTTGSLNSWDIPLNDWLGIKFGVGEDDTVNTAVNRWSEDQSDDSPEMRPDVANNVFGIPGHLKFDAPVKVQTAMRKKERKERELRYAALLNAASHDSLSWKAAAGTAAMMLGSVANPLDLGLTFIPFIGEEKIAAGVARFGARAALNRGILGTTADLAGVPILRRFPNLTAAVINGSLGNAVAEIPIAYQKWADQADYGLGDSAANIAFGGVAGGAFHGLGRILKSMAIRMGFLDPATAAEVLSRNATDALTGKESSGHEFVRVSEDEIAREIRAKNLFDEEAAAARVETGPETIVAAAIRVGDEIRSGPAHPLIEGFTTAKPEDSGFLTSAGRFVSREEANAIAGQERMQSKEFKEGLGRWVYPEDAAKVAGTHAGDYAFSKTPVTKEQVTTERAKRISEYVEREKARHEIEVTGKIKDEVASRIAAQQAQGRLIPEKEIEQWTKSESIEPAHVEAMKKDAQTIEQQMMKSAEEKRVVDVNDADAVEVEAARQEKAIKAQKERIAKIKEQAAADPESQAISQAIDCVTKGPE